MRDKPGRWAGNADMHCPCCWKTVRRRWGKHTSKHTCPHGKPCWAGDKRAAAGGWNPGGIAHRIRCAECAAAITRPKGAPDHA